MKVKLVVKKRNICINGASYSAPLAQPSHRPFSELDLIAAAKYVHGMDFKKESEFL
jgi:hypothetical protein